MNVLVACEESQTVCKAFRDKGHNAFSCDIQPCSGGHPEWHIQGDALQILEPKYIGDALGSKEIVFFTCDWVLHSVDKWDLIIAHPPCTYLTIAGACNIKKDPERLLKGFEAASFFLKFLNASCEHVAVENPVCMKYFGLPKYDQLVRPYMFGDCNNKAICLWLKGLPKLNPTSIFFHEDTDIIRWVGRNGKKKSCSRWYNTNTHIHSKHRSKFFPGVANAMALQWGCLNE